MSFFSPQSTVDDRPKMGEIPGGLLAKGVINEPQVCVSTNTGGEYVKFYLVVSSGRYAKQRIFRVMVGSPVDQKNSEAYRKMGMIDLTRIYEACGIFRPGDDASYARFGSNPTFAELVAPLAGQEVAFKTGIEKGTGGYGDKTKVAHFLTPSPMGGDAYKDWVKLHDPAYKEPEPRVVADTPAATGGGLAAGTYANPQSVGVGGTGATGPKWASGAADQTADQGDSAATADPVPAGQPY